MEILQPFSKVTELIQGDNYVTISCVVPSVVALLKCLAGLSSRARYHGALVKSMIASIHRRFSGLLHSIQMKPGTTSQLESEPFEQLLYPAAAVMDPAYGFVWLESDHPGDEEVKAIVKETVIGKIRQFYVLCLKVSFHSVTFKAHQKHLKLNTQESIGTRLNYSYCFIAEHFRYFYASF